MAHETRWLIRTLPTASAVLCSVALALAVLGAESCSALNPAFVDVVLPGGTASTIDNAPGHVVIQFVNNAEVDERLIAYVTSDDGGDLDLTDLERRQLRPRVRLRVQVTFTDGSVNIVEFVDGSARLVDQAFDVTALPDLNQNDLTNAVVLCDVAAVEIAPQTDIEVFVPVPLVQYEIVEVVDANEIVVGVTPVARQQLPPQFRPLQVDEIDEDGNVLVRRNIGVRDVPSPIPEPLCGSVVTIVMNGVLSVPFLDEFGIEFPSFDQDDASSVGGIGGRYEFVVGVR